MGRHLVTAVGAAAWVAALWLVVQLRATRRGTVDPGPEPGTAARAAWATRRVAGAAAGAFVAGALVLGLGSRLMMRVLAATSPDSAQGRTTEAEEVVGEVTLGGTVGLVLFVGLAGGAFGLLLYSVLRRWLPDRSLTAGAICGAIGTGLLIRPSDLLDPANRDFAILEPAGLAVGLVVGLCVTFALLGAVLMDRWSSSWPPPGRSVTGAASLLPLAPFVLAPPLLLAVAAVVAVRTYLPATAGTAVDGSAGRLLRAAVVVAGVAGAAWTAAAALEILTA